MDWFLYGSDFCHERVNRPQTSLKSFANHAVYIYIVPLKDSISIIVSQSHFVIIFIDSALAAIAEIDPFI